MDEQNPPPIPLLRPFLSTLDSNRVSRNIHIYCHRKRIIL